MKITWLGHACCKVESKGFSIVLDPYNDGAVPGLAPVREKANMVICSHEHGDHNARGNVTIEESIKSPFTIEAIQTYHDEVKGAKRGRNTIHILDDGSCRIAHFGDIGCELTAEQLKKLQGLDIALIPVGGFYTIDGAQAAELVSSLQPRLAIPLHFRDDVKGFGYDVIDTVEAFTAKFQPVASTSESGLDTADGIPEGVLVLTPANLC